MPPERGRLLDRLVDGLSWIWVLLMGLIGVSVVLRYAFGAGRVDLEELQWHLYAAGFLTGIVACARHDRHVRVDVLRERMTARSRAWIDFYGLLLLQFPFLLLVLWSAGPFVLDSFVTQERSAAAGGLPFRWILKAVLPVAFLVLTATSLTRLAEVMETLFGSEAQPPDRDLS